MRLEIIPVESVQEIKEGDNLVRIFFEKIKANGITLEEDDMIIFASKVVSKSEGRIVEISSINPSKEAEKIAKTVKKDSRIVQLIINESKEIVKVKRDVIITETKNGHICANAGVDVSNIDGGMAVLLPEKAQSSAIQLRKKIEEESGKKISVLIADSCGRAFRVGVVGTCIGISGIPPLLDRRGEEDRFGKISRITKVGIADEICAAANLVMGEFKEGIPIVIARGLEIKRGVGDSDIKDVFFSKKEDIFR